MNTCVDNFRFYVGSQSAEKNFKDFILLYGKAFDFFSKSFIIIFNLKFNFILFAF